MSVAPVEPMACLSCGYALDPEAPDARCPECGREFDPADNQTYSIEPVPEWWGRLLRHPATWLIAGTPIATIADAFLLRGRSPYALILLVNIAAMGWYVYDCKRRRRRPKVSYALVMFIFPPFLALYAIVVHRGRGAFIALSALAALYVCLILSRLTSLGLSYL